MTGVSDLKDRLRTDLTAAIKARDEVRSSTLRMVLTAITNAEVAGKSARELTDEDVVGVLAAVWLLVPTMADVPGTAARLARGSAIAREVSEATPPGIEPNSVGL